jgi:hypothetical protein
MKSIVLTTSKRGLSTKPHKFYGISMFRPMFEGRDVAIPVWREQSGVLLFQDVPGYELEYPWTLIPLGVTRGLFRVYAETGFDL